jgi:hypothetical protein
MTLTWIALGFLGGVVFWHQLGWWMHRTDNPDDETLDAFVTNLNTNTLERLAGQTEQELQRREPA